MILQVSHSFIRPPQQLSLSVFHSFPSLQRLSNEGLTELHEGRETEIGKI